VIETTEGYDIIGDVHGHADKLVELLGEMAYEEIGGVWTHPVRTAIFVGDLIDRGPKQVETVALVRRMVEAGTAQIILGNHEFNAVSWATRNPEEPGEYLRRHNRKHYGQHREYLRQVGEWSELHHEHLRWFMTLPLWLDLGDLRVVHACWDPTAMADLAGMVGPGNTLTDDLVLAASDKDTRAHRAIEHLLKGPEIWIPEPYLDKDGNPRHKARYAWWLADAASSLRRAAVIPEGSETPEKRDYPPLPETPVDPPPPVDPYADHVSVFYGHYWERGTPTRSGEHTACVDYSAGKGGRLVAYRWSGEANLRNDRFVRTA
jgi:hypothetical protein